MKLVKNSILLLLLCVFFVQSAAASSEIKLSDFTNNSNPVDGVGDAKPLMIEVIMFVVGIFLVSCIIGVFASGSTANLGNVIHNVTIRSRGITGVVIVLGVIFSVIITLVLFFHLYNTYLAGA